MNLRHWIFGLESASALARMPNTDLWYLTLDIPHGSRVEYKFEIHRHGGSEWIEDPRNPNRARDPFGANSVLQGEGYEVPDWIAARSRSRARASLEPFAFHSKALRRHAHRRRSTCPRASARRASIRCSSSTTAATT